MAVLEAGGSSHMQDTSTPIVLQAFALRVEQLSAHELYRITSLSGAIDDELSERIRRVSPGVEYSAMALYESVKRFHSADSLGERLLNTAYIAAAHVYSTHHQDGGGVALRSLMAQRMADPAVAEALTTALRPWVTVCGRLPGTEITPLIDPHAPSAIRDEQTVGMLQSMAPPPPVIKGPPGVRRLDQPPRPRRNTVIGDVTPPEDTSMARRRWWQRSRRPSAVAALVWNPTLDRHDAVLRDYLTFEIDPQLILAYPAAVDVHVPATRAFHEAAEYASALRTENGPTDTGHAEAYRLAVDALQAAWTEAKRHAHIVGRSYLDQAHARGLERISALLSHADSTDEPESNSYRSRAAELLKSQPAHRTTRAQSTLDHAVRTELTSG